MTATLESSPRRTFRHFFLRGLAILLPTILTLWLLVTAYVFVRDNIAEPINYGLRAALIKWTPLPALTDSEHQQIRGKMTDEERQAWADASDSEAWIRAFSTKDRREKLQRAWDRYAYPLDLIGLVVAIVAIYIVGRFVGSYIGSRLYRHGENVLRRLPLIRQVYPYVKQVTDFVVGGEQDKRQFNRVVAVEYPRKGLWSIGLVTGDAMRTVQQKTPVRLLTVFVPSSPTPFTGYVVTVPAEDTIDLSLTIDEALKFTVSGGVLTPPSEVGKIEGSHSFTEKAVG